MTVPPLERHVNNWTTTLSSAMASGDAVAVLTTTVGLPTTGRFRILVDSEYMIATREGAAAGQVNVVRGVESSSAAAHSSGATVTALITAGSLRAMPYALPHPRFGKLIGFTEDGIAIAGTSAPTAGVLYLRRIQVPDRVDVTGGMVYVGVGGTGATALNNSYLALFGSDGVRLGVSADQSSVWNSAGLKQAAFTADATGSLTLPGGEDYWVWLALLIGTQSTTAMQFRRATQDLLAMNALLTASEARVGNIGAAQTAVPASFTPSGITSTGASWWGGLY